MKRLAIIAVVFFILAGGAVAAVTFAAPKLHTERCAKGGEVIKKGDTLWAFKKNSWPEVLKDNPWMESEGRVIRKTADLTIVRIYPGEFVCGVTRKTAPKPVASAVTAQTPTPAPAPNPAPNSTGGTAMDFVRDWWWLMLLLLGGSLIAAALVVGLLGRRREIALQHDGTLRHEGALRHDVFVHDGTGGNGRAAAVPAPAVNPAPPAAPAPERIGQVPVPGTLVVEISGTRTGRDFVISSAVVGFTQTPVPADGHVAAAPAAAH